MESLFLFVFYFGSIWFRCMLLGHYLRGLEYRVELTELLSLPCAVKSDGDYS